MSFSKSKLICEYMAPLKKWTRVNRHMVHQGKKPWFLRIYVHLSLIVRVKTTSVAIQNTSYKKLFQSNITREEMWWQVLLFLLFKFNLIILMLDNISFNFSHSDSFKAHMTINTTVCHPILEGVSVPWLLYQSIAHPRTMYAAQAVSSFLSWHRSYYRYLSGFLKWYFGRH